MDAAEELNDRNESAQAQSWLVSPDDHGKRLDLFLFEKRVAVSRSIVQKLIESRLVVVDDRAIRSSFRLKAGQVITVQSFEPPTEEIEGEDIPLTVLYEDDEIVAIDKPAGMVVHPAKGHWSGTLTAALAFRFNELSVAGGTNRPGIVHRLDRDTSGVILVAKTDRAHMHLAKQFEKRAVRKRYTAIVSPAPDRDADLIELPIGIHAYQREKMMIRSDHPTSRPASTYYEVRWRHRGLALLDVFPRTGRTHQIRVHLAHVGYPILCDRLYSGRARVTRGMLLHSSDDDVILARQALHASSIEFKHPTTHLSLTIEAPLANDMQRTLDLLEKDRV